MARNHLLSTLMTESFGRGEKLNKQKLSMDASTTPIYTTSEPTEPSRTSKKKKKDAAFLYPTHSVFFFLHQGKCFFHAMAALPSAVFRVRRTQSVEYTQALPRPYSQASSSGSRLTDGFRKKP